MCVAYELGKLGYDCIILEARSRPGGRNWTVRGGSSETETGGDAQTCQFADGFFMNAGPMRISNSQEATIGYCREFGVRLVPFIDFNEAAYLYRPGFPKRRLREVQADWMGYTSEVLAKAVAQDQLNLPLSVEDRKLLQEALRGAGGLSEALNYPDPDWVKSGEIGSDQVGRGFSRMPGAVGEGGIPTDPMAFESLVRSGYFGLSGGVPGPLLWQDSMLTPQGGMDRLAYAFAGRLKGRIRFQSVVESLARKADGRVTVTYRNDAGGGERRNAEGDFCVCALPPVPLRKIAADFAASTRAAIATPRGGSAGKMGIQFRRRFWEQDDEIYGGASHTTLPITQIVYPSDGFGDQRGVLLGYYHFGNARKELNDPAPADRIRTALAQGGEIHPQYAKEYETAFSVAWEKIPHSGMPWVEWASTADFEATLQALAEPDGPYYFAGDWLSHMNAWQAGAFASAHHVCRTLHKRALASA
jgi:monoamine oxidase